ncbi:MAG: hypothetical protein EOM37_00525 [Proteobacteria bacterium]|nr:hypothetical protein [Alphaproteobacteria bacterium]NCC02525.1 hypothetical protein [Pseudomonadota bacterium]
MGSAYQVSASPPPEPKYKLTVAQKEELLSNAECLSILVPNGDHSPLRIPTIIGSRNFMAPYHYGRYRKTDGTLEETHAIEAMDWAWNYGEMQKYGKEVVSCILYLHDAPENNPGLSASHILDPNFHGNAESKLFTINLINLFTDSFHLKRRHNKKALRCEQVARANAEPTGILARGRVCEKTPPLLRDYLNARNGMMPMGDAKKYHNYIVQRVGMIEALDNKKVPGHLKEFYFHLAQATLEVVSALDRGEKIPRRGCQPFEMTGFECAL